MTLAAGLSDGFPQNLMSALPILIGALIFWGTTAISPSATANITAYQFQKMDDSNRALAISVPPRLLPLSSSNCLPDT
jgi:hypothetical protein